MLRISFISIACLLLVTLQLASSLPAVQPSRAPLNRTLRMNHARPSKPDDLRCTFVKLDTNVTEYITAYYPQTTKKISHHMVLFGCHDLPKSLTERNLNDGESWDCGPSGFGVCGKSASSSSSSSSSNANSNLFDTIIYAWALDAGPLKLPAESGYRIGARSDIEYLVLQMHYKDEFKEPDLTDNSGLTLEVTREELPNQVGFYILGNYGFIPPKVQANHIESACTFNYPFTIRPFAYRTHAHNLGKVISGYSLQRGNKWNELGRMSPKQPQMFYPMSTPDLVIAPNDVLLSRCTMDSNSREDKTVFGPTNKDEMCNFYVMFTTDFKDKLGNLMCFNDAQQFSWKNYLGDKIELPSRASSLEGVHLIEPDNELGMEMNME